MTQKIKGFSKLTREEKIEYLTNHYNLSSESTQVLTSYLRKDNQELFDHFSENTISNFILPFGIAPNFLINNKLYAVPMVIEESSVVAAASKAAIFWAGNGGFQTTIKSEIKTGQLHFEWLGTLDQIQEQMPLIKSELIKSVSHLNERMITRGGGIVDMEVIPTGEAKRNLWQLLIKFKTADSMGANYINSCLEEMAPRFRDILNTNHSLKNNFSDAKIIMRILSNYTPECVVNCSVSCPIDKLSPLTGHISPNEFVKRFEQSVYIATHDIYRASTHNKGIFNGIDAVVLATGNDFRAVEANAHVYASNNNHYSSLSQVNINNNQFTYTLKLPLSVGTVGGLTKSHPIAKLALELLNYPTTSELMSIIASTGLANNFMAITSLITTGIQRGHMKLHLSNILNDFHASAKEIETAQQYFQNKTVSYNEVKKLISKIRE